jgi:hypothetical protein
MHIVQPSPRLTLAAIAASVDIPTEVVEVPEWGGSVLVQGLTKAQAAAVFDACMVEGEGSAKTIDPKKLEAELLLACVVEPKLSAADLAVLEAKANAPVQRVAMACVRVAGLDKDAYTKAKS